MATPWKHPNSGIYYFRRAIPKELHKKMKKTEIKESLGTREPSIARRLFAIKQKECEDLFESARTGLVITNKKALGLAGGWLRRALSKDELQRDVNDLELVIDTNPDTEDLHSYYDPYIEEMQEAHSGGNAYRVIKAELKEVSCSEGIFIDEDAEGFDTLVEELFWVKIKYYQIINRRSDGDWSTDTEIILEKYPSIMTKKIIKTNGITLQELFERFKEEKSPTEQSIGEFLNVIRRFNEVIGVIAAVEITGQMVREFKEALIKIPSALTHKQKRLPMLELIKEVKNVTNKKLSDSTINKHISVISSVLQWASNNSFFGDNWHNPAQGKTIKRKNSKSIRLPFENNELESIFSSDIYTKQLRPKGGSGEASYWLPVIALYTGMRLEEIGQLLVQDIKQERGFWYFDVNAFDSKQLKSKPSIRKIPIHQAILNLGFINYIDSLHNSHAFPALKKNKNGKLTQYWSKWFNRYIRRIGITDSSKVFHSYRHGMKDALRNAGIDEAISDAITGHASTSVGRSYGLGYNLDILNQAIQKVHYDVKALRDLSSEKL